MAVSRRPLILVPEGRQRVLGVTRCEQSGNAAVADYAAEGPADGSPPGGDPSRPVTIAYIAGSAGVSVPTVSKVLNGKSGVSADTRFRVGELIDPHG